jgi:hypothetical protein
MTVNTRGKWWIGGAMADDATLIAAQQAGQIHFALRYRQGAGLLTSGLPIDAQILIPTHKTWLNRTSRFRGSKVVEIDFAELKARLQAKGLCVLRHRKALLFPWSFHVSWNPALRRLKVRRVDIS